MDILIDFDGTCIVHDFPNVDKYDIGAVSVLQDLVKQGHNLILFTMRSNRTVANPTKDKTIKDITGNFLDDAVNWFKENEIPLFGIQTHPNQYRWTTSPKAYGQMMIDDSALGCPLVFDKNFDRPYVDWVEVRRLLTEMNILD